MHVLRTLGEGKVLWISICTCVACARRCQEIGFLYLLAHSLGIVILLASALFLCHSASPGTACNYVHVVCIHHLFHHTHYLLLLLFHFFRRTYAVASGPSVTRFILDALSMDDIVQIGCAGSLPHMQAGKVPVMDIPNLTVRTLET